MCCIWQLHNLTIPSLLFAFLAVLVSSEFRPRLFLPYLPLNCKVYCKQLNSGTIYFIALISKTISLINRFNFQGRRNKKLFWLPAIAPLLSVILSTLIVYLTKADKHGVKIVKHIKGGLNPSSAHQLQLTGPHLGQTAKIGLISAVVALTVRVFYIVFCFFYHCFQIINLSFIMMIRILISGSDCCWPIFCFH